MAGPCRLDCLLCPGVLWNPPGLAWILQGTLIRVAAYFSAGSLVGEWGAQCNVEPASPLLCLSREVTSFLHASVLEALSLPLPLPETHAGTPKSRAQDSLESSLCDIKRGTVISTIPVWAPM